MKHFNFEFYCTRQEDILDRFQQFQSHFWHDEHQWYTDYGSTRFSSIIHTVPYLVEDFKLKKPSIKYELNKSNKFDYVKRLILYYEACTDQCQYYFSNLTSLTMGCESKRMNISSGEQIFEFISFIINLSNLQHLSISHLTEENMEFLLGEIFKKSPKLSSLALGNFDMGLYLNNDKLRNYLNKMIKTLDISACHSFESLDEIRQFCEVFSNVKHTQISSY